MIEILAVLCVFSSAAVGFLIFSQCTDNNVVLTDPFIDYPLWKVMLTISSRNIYTTVMEELRTMQIKNSHDKGINLAIERLKFYDSVCAGIIPKYMTNDLIKSLHADALHWSDFEILHNTENTLRLLVSN